MRLNRIVWKIVVAVFFIMAASNAHAALFGARSNGSLYSIDALTATATLIGFTGESFDGLAGGPAGVLFGARSNGSLYSIDALTATATLIGFTGESFDGLAWTPTIPIPAALPLFATGLGVLGFVGWRRRKAG
jgi:hypothetical protein